jgi:hypothetical protein
MRSYGQFCGLARSLDVVGDRWTLLIVRELLIRGPCRYTDLRAGLPGIPTNLLADRLREMDQAGLLRRETSPARLYLTDRAPRKPPVSIEVRDQDERVTLEAANGNVTARIGPADKPDAVIIGPTPLAWQVLLGKIDVAQARKAGLEVEGKPAVLKRFGLRPRQ